jgi:hypothetical protein
LADLADSSRVFKNLLVNNLEQLIATIEPSVRPVLELFSATKYELSEQEFLANETKDPFVLAFIERLQFLLSGFQTHLTENNFALLLQIFIRTVVLKMEKIVFQHKKFTQFGGLQFDKDLRTMILQFSSQTPNSTIRVEFARIIQIASILNLESVQDVLSFWGDQKGSITWRLSAQEVRRVLSRRIEFSPVEIASIQL